MKALKALLLLPLLPVLIGAVIADFIGLNFYLPVTNRILDAVLS